MDSKPSEAALLLIDQINQTDALWAAGGLERINTALVIDAYAAERERMARQTALDQACRAMCLHCERGNVPTYSPSLLHMAHWTHTYSNPDLRYACDAGSIRDLTEPMNEVTPC